jgi:hypothetical protein
MDEALSEWLKLREGVDAVSRSNALTRAVTHALTGSHIDIVDLATGAGSNLRYLAPQLPSVQRWLVVDRSPTLLSSLLQRTAAWAAQRGAVTELHSATLTVRDQDADWQIETAPMDLVTLDPRLLAGRALVTASALLDLVSKAWLRSLAACSRAAGAVALFPIVYNGRSSCSPEELEDSMIRDLFNEHQHRDKGLGGPAAGPEATDAAVQAFTAEGYRVLIEASDWILDDGHAALQEQLIEGWATASTEVKPRSAGLIADWRARRVAHVRAGRSRIRVGHYDIAALL